MGAAAGAPLDGTRWACCSNEKGGRPCFYTEPEAEIGLAARPEDHVLPPPSEPSKDGRRFGGAVAGKVGGPIPPSPPTGGLPAKVEVRDDEATGNDVLEAEKEFRRQQLRQPSWRRSNSRWEPPTFPKTPQEKMWLTVAISKSFLFSSLAPEDLEQVVMAFQEWPVFMGERVIEQGAEVEASDPGLFVLETGKMSVYKDGGADPVCTYDQPGQYFGDLALLYNAPRAATVEAATADTKLWCIDRNTYNFLVRDAAAVGLQKRIQFLDRVPILRGLTSEERVALCDALQVRTVPADTAVVREGDEGSEFFIIEYGKCEARRAGSVLRTFEASDYFGELALLRSAPRACDVVAVEVTKLLVVCVDTFVRLIGPLKELLEERLAEYGALHVEAVRLP